MVSVRKPSDSAVEAIASAARKFEADHPDAEAEVYRYNSSSIRLRIVSQDFHGMNEVDRYDDVWRYIEPLDEDVVAQLSVLLLLSPAEKAGKRSLMNLEFEDPSPSML